MKTSAITSYGVLVREAGGGEYMVPRANPADLKKVGPPKHTPIRGESLMCQKEGGCIDLILRTWPDVERKTRVALGMPIHFLMGRACAVLQEPRSCQTRLALWHRGRPLSPSWRIFESRLANGAVVDVRLAPETVTPLWEVPE